VPVLALKLLLTPLLIGGATLVARRWGPRVGGLIVALPLTSGPVLVFLALDQGPAFASTAALGSLAGLAAIAAFCAAYAVVARRRGPALCLLAATAAFIAAAVVVQPFLDLPTWAVLGGVLVAIAVAPRLIPASGVDHAVIPYPWWDIPARMVVATFLVLAITAIAPLLGPHWSGVVATFPVYLSVLTVFIHRHAGPTAGDDVLRGLLVGLYGTSAYFVVMNVGLEPLGVGLAFASAVAITLAIEAVALWWVRSDLEPEPA
jgi:hypothetical protein